MSGEVKRAIISVSDKTGLVPFVRSLQELGVEVISTGHTHRLLEEGGLQVTSVSEVTGFPEILDGRVKTLHPNIHSGILAIREKETHRRQLSELNIQPIDLVCVNLYPFKETLMRPGVTEEEAIENIDIGGPSLLRAAAKNYQDVTVVVDAQDYDPVIEELHTYGAVRDETRRKLAAKAFRHTAAYDALIAETFSEQSGEELSEKLTLTYEKVQDLRYGENPHQAAAFYREPLAVKGAIATARQLNGKELSYNNIQDADAAISLIKEFELPAAVGIKHTNPCGVGTGETLLRAWHKAYEADPVSIFGGIVAVNRTLDRTTAEALKELFLEIVIAPSFDEEALALLKQKKNLRLLEAGDLAQRDRTSWKVRSVEGGLLVQESDDKQITAHDLQVVTERTPDEAEVTELLFAWKVVKHVKSNAIVLASVGQTVGVGAGQMNRVGAARIAIEQAGEKAKGAVLASDAFFPMPDTVQEAAKAGITAIIQPGGSIRDKDSIEEANRHGIAMVFTGVRHFRH